MEKTRLPRTFNYGDYSSGNYGAHTIGVEIPPTRKGKHGITLYYSYNTCVAFSGFVDGKNCFVIHKNIWGSTTGKHLNFIDDNKDKRVDSDTFNRMYAKAIKNA